MVSSLKIVAGYFLDYLYIFDCGYTPLSYLEHICLYEWFRKT